MPERLTAHQRRAMQARIAATRKGEWVQTEDGFGPFAFVEAWVDDELGPAVDFCVHARTDMPLLIGEVAAQETLLRVEKGHRERAERDNQKLTARVEELEQRLADAQSNPLGWAAALDADDLEAFLASLSDAAAGDDDLSTLRTVEKVIAEARAIAAASRTGGDR